MLSVDELKSIKKAKYPEDAIEPLRALPVLEVVRRLEAGLLADDAPEASAAAVGILWRSCLLANKSEATLRPEVDPAALSTVIKFLAEKSLRYATAEEAFAGLANVLAEGAVSAPDEAVTALTAEWLPAAGVQRQATATRRNVFVILEHLAARRESAFVAGGASFVRGFIEATDGERDPENVLKAFKLNAKVIACIPGDVAAFLSADLFDNLAAYFPVLFAPPPGCPVTKSDLREALHGALAASRYSEFCLPFVCSKMTSPAAGTKSDVVDVVMRCIDGASTADADDAATAGVSEQVAGILPHMGDVLTALRAEVLRMTALGGDADQELLQRVLACMCSCATAVRRLPAQDLLSPLGPVINGATSTVETGSPAARAYATMVHATAAASPSVCLAMMQYLLPLMVGLASEQGATSAKVDGAIAIVAAVLASAERCFAKGDRFKPPVGRLLADVVELLRMVRTGSIASCSSTFSRGTAVEAESTLCALGHVENLWYDDDAAAVTYTALAELALGKIECDRELSQRAARAAANAMRVDSTRGPASIERLATSIISDGQAASTDLVVGLGEAMSAIGQSAAAAAAVRILLTVDSDSESLWNLIADAAPLAAKADGRADLLQRLVSSNCLATATDRVCRAMVEVMRPMSVDEVEASVGGVDNEQPIRIAALIACSPLKMADVVGKRVPIADTARQAISAWAETPSGLRGLLGVVVAHCNVTDRSSLAATITDDAPLDLVAQMCKGLAMKGDEAARAFERRLFAAFATDDGSCSSMASQCVAAVLTPPKLVDGAAFMWEQRYFFVLLSSTREAATATASSALCAALPVARQEHIALASKELADYGLGLLNSRDSRVKRASGARILSTLLDVAPEDLVDRLLQQPEALVTLAMVAPGLESMHVRAETLSLLADIARKTDSDDEVTLKVLLKVKDRVAAAARPALEDKKRLVRSAAARCRHYWMLLEAPAA